VLGIAVVYQFALYVALFMFKGHFDFWFYVRAIILPKTVYTSALAIPLYTFMHFVNRRVEIFEHNRRSLFEEKKDD
jgi:hypothetical protein